MKLPIKNSRGRVVLEALCNGPATVHQGIERHGDLGISLIAMRRLYVGLELTNCCSSNGLVYTITQQALNMLRPSEPIEPAASNVTPPRYQGDWQGPALTASSALRAGSAFGFSRDVIAARG